MFQKEYSHNYLMLVGYNQFLGVVYFLKSAYLVQQPLNVFLFHVFPQ